MQANEQELAGREVMGGGGLVGGFGWGGDLCGNKLLVVFIDTNCSSSFGTYVLSLKCTLSEIHVSYRQMIKVCLGASLRMQPGYMSPYNNHCNEIQEIQTTDMLLCAHAHKSCVCAGTRVYL